MVFPIAGGTQDTGYEISNSLRFNDGDSANLSRSISSSGSNTNASISFWLKRGTAFGSQQILFTNTKTDYYFRVALDSSARLEIIDVTNGSVSGKRVTNRLFRDPSAFYHIFIGVDGGQGTEENRVKVYINGVAETSWSSETAWQSTFQMNADDLTHYVGQRGDSNQYFDGYMSEFNYVDGTTKAYTDFGEFNDNGVWIPKKYTGSYGTNGFFLEFQQTGTSQNSSGIGADTSGNDNHFAVSNLAAIDVTTDTPTNNFNTLNPLVPHNSIFEEEAQGNTGLSSSGVQLRGGYMGSTIMPTSGKWYFEVKIVTITNSTDRTGIAIPRFESVTGDDHIEGGDYAGLTLSTGATGRVFVTEGSSTTETDNSDYVFSNDDIAIFAVDTDASTPRVYVGKNGTWFTTSAGSGGNPATNTGYFEVNLNTGGSGFSVGARHSAGASAAQSYLYNFGQPAYTISSGNSDANGYGNFEYAVPSGYYSICTKNLAEFG